jgi:hypothetical protein
LIPLSRGKRYRLTSRLRREGNLEAVSYVAVAWFNAQGELLKSNVAAPEGAGEPLGWSNGTYSYYNFPTPGAPSREASYSLAFGIGESAEIPREAKYLRVGALLNYRATAGGKVTLLDVSLVEDAPPARLLMEVPDFSLQTTPRSLSAVLSAHWPPNHVSAAQAAARELRDALDSAVKR